MSKTPEYIEAQRACVIAFEIFAKSELGAREHLWEDYVVLRERFMQISAFIRRGHYAPLMKTKPAQMELMQ